MNLISLYSSRVRDFSSCRKGGSSKELFPGLDGIEDSTSIMKEKQKNSKNVSFRAKNGQKRVISGEKHQSRSMSFPAKITKPGTCHSGPRAGIQGHSRHLGFLLSRNIARYFFSFFTRSKNPISSSEFLKPVIPGNKRPKTCHFGQKTPIQDHVIPGSDRESSRVSFRAQTRNPGAFRLPGFLLARV